MKCLINIYFHKLVARQSLNKVFANRNQLTMQYTSKVFKYLHKLFYIRKCLTSNVATIILIKTKYYKKLEVKVVYGKSGDFTLYNLKLAKISNGNLPFERGMGMWNISQQFLFGILKVLCIPFLIQ